MEPIGTFLMPLYAIASWYGLYTHGNTGKYMLPVSLVGWLWAVINVIRTKRLDLGIVTFFFVLLTSLYERHVGLFTRGMKLSLCISSILVATNYSLVIAFWKQIRKDLVKSKSELWCTIFYLYCAAMMAFWVCACARTHVRGETGYVTRMS